MVADAECFLVYYYLESLDGCCPDHLGHRLALVGDGVLLCFCPRALRTDSFAWNVVGRGVYWELLAHHFYRHLNATLRKGIPWGWWDECREGGRFAFVCNPQFLRLTNQKYDPRRITYPFWCGEREPGLGRDDRALLGEGVREVRGLART